MWRGGTVLALTAALAGCGYVGDPLPPSLDIPIAVRDLAGAEFGDQIRVAFTLPSITTEGLPLKSVDSVELAIGSRSFAIPNAKPGAIEHEVSAREFVGQDVQIRVRSTGPKRKQSAWSNIVTLNVIEPLTQPANLRAQNVAKGVELTWSGTAPKYRVFRATENQPPQRLGDSDRPEYLDETSIYGTRYRYLVQGLVSESQQSPLTPEVTIEPEDKFPPAVPSGVNAIAANQSVELGWERNTEDDFASYSVYRSTDGGPFQKIAMGLDSPTYSDRMIGPGRRYRYQVTAIDANGNESTKSETVEVAVP